MIAVVSKDWRPRDVKETEKEKQTEVCRYGYKINISWDLFNISN